MNLRFVLLCVAGATGAYVAPDPASPSAAPAIADCPGAADVAMIKFDNIRPAVEVMVDGQGPFLFLIDTGDEGQMRADTNLVERLHLPLTGETIIDDGSAQPRRTVPNASIRTLTIGSATFHGLSGPSRDYNRGRSPRRIDGILGFDLFAPCLLTLDYARGRVILGPGALAGRDPEVVAFDRTNGTPGFWMTIGAERAHGDLDTGSNQGFSLPQTLAARLTLTAEPIVTGHAEAANTRFAIRKAPIRETIRIGPLRWPAPTVEFTESFDFINIGSEVLADTRITFDQRRGLARLRRPDPRPR
jgi:hypothetical protein